MQTTSTPTIHVGAIEISFLVEAADSQGAATVFECLVPHAARVPAPHSHDGFEETVYGLAGVTTFTVDGELHELHPGEVVFIARGAVHAFENRSADDARSPQQFLAGCRCGRAASVPGTRAPASALADRSERALLQARTAACRPLRQSVAPERRRLLHGNQHPAGPCLASLAHCRFARELQTGTWWSRQMPHSDD